MATLGWSLDRSVSPSLARYLPRNLDPLGSGDPAPRTADPDAPDQLKEAFSFGEERYPATLTFTLTTAAGPS